MIIAPTWTIANLKKYGNSLIPNDYIDEHGKDTVERYLSAMINSPVKIREIEIVYLEKYRVKKEKGYIADDQQNNHFRTADKYTGIEKDRNRNEHDPF